MSRPVRIAVIMACFNRKQTTLRCLKHLYAQQSESISLDVHLLDDASPDGTGLAVRADFPQVHVIDGDGQRFWGGGMYLAMQSAAKTDHDFVLWLNDDVTLHRDALKTLLSADTLASAAHGNGRHIIVGAVTDPATGEFSYSGFRRRNRWHPAQLDRVPPQANGLTACDTMNGNCVLVPAAVAREIGPIDPIFIHQLGDIDYGYRASKARVKIWIAPNSVGYCQPNTSSNRLRDGTLTLSARLRLLNTPHGLPIKPWLTFMWRYGGPIGLILVAASYFRIMIGRPAKTRQTVGAT